MPSWSEETHLAQTHTPNATEVSSHSTSIEAHDDLGPDLI